jgi:hypothetical protein
LSSTIRKRSLFAVLAALGLALALALGALASPASAQTPEDEECAEFGGTFTGVKIEGQGEFEETVTVNGTTVTLTGEVSGDDLLDVTTDPPTSLLLVIKSGQNPLVSVTTSATGGPEDFLNVVPQDISHVTVCIPPAGTTTTGTTTTGTTTTGTTTAVTTTGTGVTTTTGVVKKPPTVIVKKKPDVIVKQRPHVVVKKKGVVVAKGTATPTATVTAKATATPTAKTVTATATPTAKTVTATVTAKAAKAQYAQYKQYATATALPPTGGGYGSVLPIAVGALLLVLGSGIMVLRMARSSS